MRDQRAAYRFALREKMYNDNMLVGISAIDTANKNVEIAPIDAPPTDDELIKDFTDIYEILNNEKSPIHSSLSEGIPAHVAEGMIEDIPEGVAEGVAEGGKRTIKRRPKRHIKTRKHRKVRK